MDAELAVSSVAAIFGLSSEGLLQSFLRMVISWRADSEEPRPHWNIGEARTCR